MSASQQSARHLGEDADASDPASASKAARTSNAPQEEWTDLFQVDISIPSSSKALRNDYQSPTSAQLKMRAIFNGIAASPLTDEERREILGNDRSVMMDNSFDEDENNVDECGDISSDEDDSNMDEYDEFDWLEAINGRIRSRQGTMGTEHDPVGSCTSTLIRRNKIQNIFYHEIEGPSQETSAMGFALFDRYGRLKPALKKNAVKQGSGIWGDELDVGDIHLIDQVHIDKQHRRKGLGKKLVEAVLDRGQAKSNPKTYIAIARTATLRFETDRECEGKTKEEEREISFRQTQVSECFLRSLGFRRIGSTEWFARTGDKNHRCHSLPADQDFDPPSPPPSAPNGNCDTMLKILKPLKEDEARLNAMRWGLEIYGPEDITLASTDGEGNTLLHHVADLESPLCVKWILSRRPNLADARNFRGDTPLQSFEEKLEIIRTQKACMMAIVPVSDEFSGYSEALVKTLVAMKGLDNPGPQDLLRLKYGCTCGQCQSGFFSPRMRFVVLTRAEIEHDTLLDNPFASDGDDFVDYNANFVRYLPTQVRDNLRTNDSMRQGFVSLFGYFARCLRNHEIPLSETILGMVQSASEWPPVTKNYLSRGGTVYAVGSALFQSAMQSSLLAGDGSTEDVFDKDINELPPCRNDDEFGFASGMCGYKRVC
ncbi:hypothetical protein F5Y18DRAFT_324274 [Xylariaceae sp. FL1019]|nr:hypothetical protein F5Y18DRAFT_324274 [Xylariaceae sp. FL1019]